MQVPTTGLEVARTEIAMGKLIEAHDKLLAVARTTPVPGEPRPFADARAMAETLGNDTEARIPTLKITLIGLAASQTPRVAVDGAEIPPAALAAPRAINPGHHVVTANADGPPRTQEMDIAERETKEVTLDLSAPPPPPSEPDGSPRNHTLSFIGFGVGAAGIIAGSVTGLLAISSFNSAKSKGCVGNRCPPASDGDLDNASTMATASDIAFIIGGVGVAVGVVGLFVGNRGSSDANVPSGSTAAFTVSPWLGAGSAGLHGTF